VLLDENGEIIALPDDDVVTNDQTGTAPDEDAIANDDEGDEAPVGDAQVATDGQRAKKQDGQSAFAYIPLPNNPDVLRIQRELKRQFPDERIKWQAAPTLHITLCAGDLSDSAIDTFSALSIAKMELKPSASNPITYFETPDGKALHIALDVSDTTRETQETVYQQFWKVGEVADDDHFESEQWKPHITLGYLPNEIDIPDFSQSSESPSFVIQSDTVIVGRNDYDPVLILTAPNHVKARKDVTDTQTAFIQRFNALLNEARENNINRTRAGLLIRGLIRTMGGRVYGDGMEEGGVPRERMDASDNAEIARLVAAQSQYVGNLTDVLFNQDGISDAQAAGKAVMWFNKSINPFYDAGRMSANANGMYEFKVGNTEHCPDCLMLNGQIHRLKEFIQSGWHPKSSRLKCKGYRCECELVKRRGAAARGQLPSGSKVIHVHQMPHAA
jgi:2'-5' RNA ligase